MTVLVIIMKQAQSGIFIEVSLSEPHTYQYEKNLVPMIICVYVHSDVVHVLITHAHLASKSKQVKIVNACHVLLTLHITHQSHGLQQASQLS